MLLAQSALAGSYSGGAAIVGGLLGGLVFLMVVYMGLAVGMTRMDFLHILGSMMAPRSSVAAARTLGFVAHMMLSVVFGLVHAGLLHAVDVTSVAAATGWDALFGLVHGVLVLMMMPVMLNAMHPLVREGKIESPGVAMVGFGSMTPAGSLMAHVAFGVVTGAYYAAVVI